MTGNSERTERARIARAAGSMSAATMISRILGYVRDMLIAFFLGAGGLSDTFLVAFRIPNLLRELFAEGSMSSAVVPVLTEYESRDRAETVKLVRITFTFILVFVGAFCLLAMVFAPAIVATIAPGFLRDPQKFHDTVRLTRLMFPFLFFVSMAALVMGALNTRRVFFLPALAPAMLNVTIISVTLLSVGTNALDPITAVAVGVALGGLVQFAFQCPGFIRMGYSLRPLMDFRHPGLRRMCTLLIPAVIGMAVAQINIVVSNILASFLPEGSITYLFYSMRLVQFPIGVFGVAMAMAVLPSLSRHAAAGRMDELKSDFSFALRLLFFIGIPAMAGLIALREPIVSVLFERGRFDPSATRGTADALLYYATGVWAFVGVRVVAATFYSMQDTRTPMRVAVVSLILNLVFSVLLMGPMLHSGLALSNALSSAINFTALIYILRNRLGGVRGREIALSFARTALASALMGIAGYAFIALAGWPGGGAAASALRALMLCGAISVSLICYIVVARVLGSDELRYLTGALRRRFAPGA